MKPATHYKPASAAVPPADNAEPNLENEITSPDSSPDSPPNELPDEPPDEPVEKPRARTTGAARTSQSRLVPSFSALWPSLAILVTALGLAALGLVILASASVRDTTSPELRTLYMKQLIFAGIAVILCGITWIFDLQFVRRLAWFLYAAILGVLALVLVPGIGTEVYGARRWLSIAGFSVQPSDLAKVALVFILAHYLDYARRKQCFAPRMFTWANHPFKETKPSHLPGFKRLLWWFCPYIFSKEARRDVFLGFVIPCGIIALPCGLLVLEPDLGTTILFAIIGMFMLFMAGARLRYLVPVAAMAVPALSLLIYKWPEKLIRVTTFIDPFAVRDNPEGQQLWEGLVGLSIGGVHGCGIGKGTQQQYFLPMAHNDSILAIVGEQLGLVGTALVATLFLTLFATAMGCLWRTRNFNQVSINYFFQFNVCLGAVLFIVCQSLINMGVVTDHLPTKGIALPFISAGGTNIVATFILTGLILNCLRCWAKASQQKGEPL